MSRGRLTTPTTVFGRRLRHAREVNGLTQIQLGVMIGLDEGSSSARLSRYESGVHEPSTNTAAQIAEALGVPVAYLYCLDDDLAELILSFTQLKERDKRDLKAWLKARLGD